ncbi:HNH endonuclease [Mycetocola zhadangensis]|uniref:HNH endonuclease n=1 Tax=Mycetocola zhadangensis TaxID=1164595 RepID=A0A3L7J0Y5_9MICO|nr:HNH endonuclease [Mycetocola zhadangensis]RLQ84110.1 HNH endonuclease [Mycetocola zhadangensis]GGE96076.1 restriction endonuclease [Mycetocola zhadangensis]
MLELRDYLQLSRSAAEAQWREVLQRSSVPAGARQVDFAPIETLLCFGLGLIGHRSKRGNINISERDPVALKLASLVKRTPASLAAKLANLDGRRPNSARHERALWVALTNDLFHFGHLYATVIDAARLVGIDENQLPDFLDLPDTPLHAVVEADRISTDELRDSIEDEIRDWMNLNPGVDTVETERAMLGSARVGQQQFARKVLSNAGFACVFCGLSFKAMGLPSARMLVASHIKPWKNSIGSERIDPLNGLAACPTHDAAFDAFLITVLPDLSVVVTRELKKAIAGDAAIERNFGQEGLVRSLRIRARELAPGERYLSWHRKISLGREVA